MLLLQALRLKLACGSDNGSGLPAFLPCCQEVLTAIPKVRNPKLSEVDAALSLPIKTDSFLYTAAGYGMFDECSLGSDV